MPDAHTYFYPAAQPYELLLDPVSCLTYLLHRRTDEFRRQTTKDSDAQ